MDGSGSLSLSVCVLSPLFVSGWPGLSLFFFLFLHTVPQRQVQCIFGDGPPGERESGALLLFWVSRSPSHYFCWGFALFEPGQVVVGWRLGRLY